MPNLTMMHDLAQLQETFEAYFAKRHFPDTPASLYDPADYFLGIGGKRVRPVMCLMGNELFDEIHPDAYPLAAAIELFHNFTLVHDDIMDKAPLRRGMPTVHQKYGEPTALLGGDVMLVTAYEYINRIDARYLRQVLRLFNTTAKEVCEGQQLDMDFERQPSVSLDAYIHMIGLKTSVLLAASLRMGAILGGAGEANQRLLYAFGRKLGIAFQIQDDYLDAFGDPLKFGKQVGGDIMSNKKTFLLIHALETADAARQAEIRRVMASDGPGKVQEMLDLFRACGIDAWARALKDRYIDEAATHLDDIAVTAGRKEPLRKLMHYLVQRDH
jgi:geranylgeranyl diphosphate synthase type II